MTSVRTPDPLVSTAWLAAHLHDADVRVLDATFHLPHLKRDPRAEYLAAHIPGAAYFDIDGIADHSTDLPHMLPSPDAFAAAVGALGIDNNTLVVCYGAQGMSSSPRVWWTFRAFGHDNVCVLDGGLPKWKSEGRPVEGGDVVPPPRSFTPHFRRELVRARADILANVRSHAAQVIDARPAGRFQGKDPEPRAGLRGGHIPGSFSVPLTTLIDDKTQTLLPASALRERFTAAGVDLAGPMITSCGSGVTASGLALALFLLGRGDVPVYDGSWSEWGLPGDTPVDKS